jgi:hypothetical protein
MLLMLGVGLVTLIATAGEGAAGAVTLGTDVAIGADDDDSFPASYEVVDRLAPETVLRMRVAGFEPFTRAIAEQCTGSGSGACENAIPVQFDAGGYAHFQYLVTDAFLPTPRLRGRCRADAAPCTVVVRAIEGAATRAEVQTIFVDAARPAGRITVTPTRRLSLGGETVTVDVDGYPPGVTVTAMLCAAPNASGPRCGRPGPHAPLVVGSDGTGRTTLFVEPGGVGSQRARCSRRDDCGVSVASDEVFVRAPVVPISFVGPPGAAYESTRLAIGLGLGALLAALAGWLILRSDWSVVGEAAAPELDDADYADLDAIIAALPPDDPGL